MLRLSLRFVHGHRRFECALLESKRGGAKQAERVASLYARQLAVPLADTAATYEEYKAWEAGRGQVCSRVLIQHRAHLSTLPDQEKCVF